jgi:N6-L-threonylcarbamoyladenine synthase
MVRAKALPADDDYFDLSFSGLKTAVLLAVRDAENGGTLETTRPMIARAFQDAVVDTLVEKVDRAVRLHRRRRVILGGGVACNGALQQGMRDRLERRGVEVFAPSPRLATDNAAMIAAAGMFRFAQGERASPTLSAQASLPMPGLIQRTLPIDTPEPT